MPTLVYNQNGIVVVTPTKHQNNSNLTATVTVNGTTTSANMTTLQAQIQNLMGVTLANGATPQDVCNAINNTNAAVPVQSALVMDSNTGQGFAIDLTTLQTSTP